MCCGGYSLAARSFVVAPVVSLYSTAGTIHVPSMFPATPSGWALLHALSPAQDRGPCLHARVLPRGDGFVRAREGVMVENIFLQPLLERVCTAPGAVL